jgi:hypothetical protein
MVREKRKEVVGGREKRRFKIFEAFSVLYFFMLGYLLFLPHLLSEYLFPPFSLIFPSFFSSLLPSSIYLGGVVSGQDTRLVNRNLRGSSPPHLFFFSLVYLRKYVGIYIYLSVKILNLQTRIK